MKYYYEYEIKYQEVDASRRLRLNCLENYLLEVAGLVADKMGFGILTLHPEGLTWILSRMSVEMDYLPTYCEKMVIETWIENNAHMLSTRDYRIYIEDKDGNRRQIGQCKSQWAVLDLEKREIANIFDRETLLNSIDGEVLDLGRTPRLLPIADPTGIVEHTVQYSEVDYNMHCNSCHYLENMINAALPNYQGKRLRLDITYQREVRQGERLDTYYLITEEGVQYQQKNGNGETSCSAKITISD